MSTMIKKQAGFRRYLLGTSGFIIGVLEVEPVTSHRKPFMNTANRVSNISHTTLGNPLTLRRAAVRGVDPMPGTDTTALGARRHVLGDLEGSTGFPNALVVNAENGQILRLEAVYVRSVCNGEGTTLHVVNALREINQRLFTAPAELRRLTVAKERIGRSSQSRKT